MIWPAAALALVLAANSPAARAFSATAKNTLKWKVAGVYQKAEAPRRFQSSSVGNWTVLGLDGHDCIRIEFAAELEVHAIKAVNLSDSQTPYTYTDLLVGVPTDAVADENPLNCGNETQTLLLRWKRDEQGRNGTPHHLHDSLKIVFAKAKNGTRYGIQSFYANLTHWVNVTSQKNISNLGVMTTEEKLSYVILTTPAASTEPMLQIDAGRSYLCTQPNPVNLTSTELIVGGKLVDLPRNGTVHARRVRFDAFRPSDAPPNDYRTVSDCAFQPNDVVPIAVGCALAALVMVVLIAYLVGRRKNRRSGYQSV